MGRRFVRVKAFGMVNLVAEKMIAPEFLQEAFTPEAVAGEAVRFLTDASYAAETRAALRAVREKLGGPGASRRAAEHVLAAARTPGSQEPGALASP
jgi:lipid-A-disaccharide synthase